MWLPCRPTRSPRGANRSFLPTLPPLLPAGRLLHRSNRSTVDALFPVLLPTRKFMRRHSESPSCRGHPHPPLSNPRFASPMVRSSPVLRPPVQASPAAGLMTDEAPSSQLLSFPDPFPPRHHQEQPRLGQEDDGDDSPNLATAERVDTPTARFSTLERSPAAGASSEFGFQTPTANIGTSTSHGLDEDEEMYEEDGDNNRETIDIDDSLDPEEVANATKRFRSQCWKEFVPMVVQGVVMKGRCKHCDELIGAKRGAGTSAMLNHLKRCKKRSRALRIVQDLSSTLRSPGGARLKMKILALLNKLELILRW